jgi:hypothetical protein
VIFKIITAFFIFAGSLAAEDIGSLSISIFKEGKPLKNTEILIDAQDRYTTDSDGSLQIYLQVGKHKLEIFAKENEMNLGYFRRSIEIKKDKDTQVTAEFSKDDSNEIEIDTPFDTDLAINKATGEAVFSGVVLSSETKKPISNARIFVMGSDVDARTDESGKFSFKVPSGIALSISFIHSEHTSHTLKDVVLKKDETLSKTISLTPASMELEEFIVLAPKVEGSIASVMAEEKKVNAIANILGSEQMSKRGDSSAASALKRVTGVTLIGGKSIYVRGLGDRYSNIEMNSMPLPSPDPTKRVVPLDIFPSGVIQSMKVQKSATADIPASFGGGYVDIRTKEKSKDNYIKASLEIKANSNTGKSVDSYQGSDSDILGFDDGYRDIPSDILSISEIKVGEVIPSFTPEMEREFTKNIVDRKLTTFKEALPFGGSFGIEGAHNFDIEDANKFTLFGSYKYKQDHSYKEEKYNKYNYNDQTGSLYSTPLQYGVNRISSNEYTHSAIFNIGYSYNDSLNLKLTKLYTHNSEKLTRVSDGIAGSNDSDLTRYNLNWEERTLDVNQINADFLYKIYNVDSKFDFGYENAKALLNQPGNYKYGYNNESVDGPYLDRGAANIFLNMTSDDNLDAFYFRNKFEYTLFNEGEYLDIGISSSSKEKIYRYNKYEILDDFRRPSERKEYLNDDIDSLYDRFVRADDPEYDDPFRTTINFLPEDYFDAEVNDDAYYLNTMIIPLKDLEILIGARHVDFKQTVYQYTYGDNNNNPVYKESDTLAIDDWYPSMSIKYKLDKNNHIDFAYSKTYIVPDLREFTDTTYFHPYEVADVIGNPELENTDITSYDLKYSHYFSDTENIKLGLFYKYLDKPIEDNVLASSSLARYSFHNADYATLTGFEVDGRKSMAFIDSMLKNYFLAGNFSYTSSEVTLTPEQEALFSSNKRELQGLSPFVVNLSFSYEKDYRSATLSFNKMDERIRKVGLIEDGYKRMPDDIEVPPYLLDFVWIEKYDFGMDLKVKLGNILDDETTWYQGSSSNVTKSFKTGRSFSLSASYKY